MLRGQGFKFETRLNGEQLRKVRGFAGACRFVYNKALALNNDRFDGKEMTQRLCYLLGSKTFLGYLMLQRRLFNNR